MFTCNRTQPSGLHRAQGILQNVLWREKCPLYAAAIVLLLLFTPDRAFAQFAWIVGTFGSCSSPCGLGTQTRSVQCVFTATGTVVADALCTAAKPPTTRDCNLGSCSWIVGSWGTCSVPCGVGTETRSVVCRAADGTLVLDSQCTAAKPPTTRDCNLGNCGWIVGSWSACSSSCGTSTRTRVVQCQAGNGTIVSDSQCTSAKPSTSEACNLPPCTGACCLGSGCTVVAPSTCSAASGRYAGDSSICNVAGDNVAPCCRADFNGIGGLTVQDIFAFLAAWFGGCSQSAPAPCQYGSANFNGDSVITVSDIFAFLSAWFAGCP